MSASTSDEGDPMLDLLRDAAGEGPPTAPAARRQIGSRAGTISGDGRARRLLERAEAPTDGRQRPSSHWPTR